MSRLMRFPTSVARDPAIEVWMHEHSGELGAIAQRWFEVMRGIADPNALLEGTGKFMRHVKLSPERDIDSNALEKLIETAYTDMKGRLKAG